MQEPYQGGVADEVAYRVFTGEDRGVELRESSLEQVDVCERGGTEGADRQVEPFDTRFVGGVGLESGEDQVFDSGRGETEAGEQRLEGQGAG